MAEIFKFLFFIIFFLYIPSLLILKVTKFKIGDKLVETGLALALGIVMVTLLSLFLRLFRINLSVLWLLFVISAVFLVLNLNISHPGYKLKTFIYKRNIAGNYLIILILVVAVISQNLALFRGGWKTGSGLIFPSPHDTMWNIAISSELFNHFPPQNPAISGEALKNNHYFYPLFLSVVRYFTDLNVFDLYFRFGPILVSILFGIGLYTVSSIFTQDIFFRGITIFLGFFSGNFAYFLPYFLGPKFAWKGNSFFADQPFDQLINPYTVFGFTLMLFGIYAFSQIPLSKKTPTWGYSLVTCLLLASLYGFKSFGGVVVILALGLTTISVLVYKRKLFFLPVTLISILLFLFIFFFTTDPGKASLVWAPGWLLTQLMTDMDKLNLPKFADLEEFYMATGNKLGFLKIKTVELLIYLIGNLGTRIAGFIYLFILLIRKSKYTKYVYTLWFMTFIIVLALCLPLVFNLRNSTYNVIQFTPYALVILAITGTFFLEMIYRFLNLKKKKFLGIILILVFLTLSVPVNVKSVREKLSAPEDNIVNEEIEALNYLRNNSGTDEIILINPEAFLQDPIYIPAISERRVFLSSPGFAIQTGISPDARMREIKDFFESESNVFLQKNKIGYIYLLKSDHSSSNQKMFSELGMAVIFENDRVIIWGRGIRRK